MRCKWTLPMVTLIDKEFIERMGLVGGEDVPLAVVLNRSSIYEREINYDAFVANLLAIKIVCGPIAITERLGREGARHFIIKRIRQVAGLFENNLLAEKFAIVSIYIKQRDYTFGTSEEIFFSKDLHAVFCYLIYKGIGIEEVVVMVLHPCGLEF